MTPGLHDSERGRSRRPLPVSEVATAVHETAWQRVTWATCTKGSLAARVAAFRVRPVKSRGERWLLCERSLATDERKYYPLNLEEAATLRELVTLARGRWPIEQQYWKLKDELGFDHLEGRTYRGWAHHVVLTAIAFTFLQLEHRPRIAPVVEERSYVVCRCRDQQAGDQRNPCDVCLQAAVPHGRLRGGAHRVGAGSGRVRG